MTDLAILGFMAAIFAVLCFLVYEVHKHGPRQ